MILKEHMLPLLIEASPGFAPEWESFVREWEEDPDDPAVPHPPYYIALANFARYVSRLLRQGDDLTLKRVFAVVERLHLEGDSYVREAATVGLTEDLQNLRLHDGSDPEQVVPYLLPESLRWWKKVRNFWRCGTPIRDD
jgi:hypothetical protein